MTVPSSMTLVIEVLMPSLPKEVVDVKDIPESMAPKGKEAKKKSKTKVAPEKSKKKFRTIALVKKREDENITDVRILLENRVGVCTLHVGLIVIEPEVEGKIENLEQVAKMIFSQVTYALI